jgi:hypothetical protein
MLLLAAWFDWNWVMFRFKTRIANHGNRDDYMRQSYPRQNRAREREWQTLS